MDAQMVGDLGQPVSVRPVCGGNQLGVSGWHKLPQRRSVRERCIGEPGRDKPTVLLAVAEPADDARCEERLR